jgi:TolB-like protein/DNA-binding winged helix-turn-helix (wHTH) protein/tetratricopeptide (TPR) repeat protein
VEIPTRDRGVYVFGPFQLDPIQRTLSRSGSAVELTPRLFDTLLYLVEHNDRLVERVELERAVWAGRTVDASSLGKAVAALRRVLQADEANANFIVTAPGRGYRLGVLVSFEAASPTGAPPASNTTVGPAAGRRGRWRGALIGLAAVVALVAAGMASRQSRPVPGIALQETTPPFAPPPHSIAVLAFSNLSGDPAQEYFSDGLSEELIDSLSRINDLHVAARLSAFSFKNKSPTIDELARKLNVGNVLEGSVRRDGKRLRVTAQLVDGLTGYELWSHTYDRDENDVFEVQDELTQAVAAALQVKLTGGDIGNLTMGGTHNPKALDAYLRAMATLEGPDESTETGQRMMAAFDEAVTLDPNFAKAQAHRAIAFWHIASVTEHPDANTNKRLKDEALRGAQRAVAQAPTLAEAHLALGLALDNALPDFAHQEAEFVRARALAPGSSEVARYYGRFEVLAGHAEAGVQAAEDSVALDPLTAKTYYSLAWTNYLAGRWQSALTALDHAEQLGAAQTVYIAALRGQIALMQGDPATARAVCMGKVSWQIDVCLAMANHRLGRLDEASANMARLQQTLGDTGAYNYAQVFAQWGQADEALHWLDIAFGLHDTGLILLKADPLLSPLRQLSEFRTLEGRLGFPS